MGGKVKFDTNLTQTGGNTTGIVVPTEVVESLNGGKKPKVNVVLNGFAYKSSIASMGGTFMIPVSAEIRKNANVKGGDPINVELELDTSVREVIVPSDFASALASNAAARAKFEALSYSNKSRHVLSIEGAKTEETRTRRIEKAIVELEI